MTATNTNLHIIKEIYKRHGDARYGEKMSLISHSLQAALFAEKATDNEAIIVAAFLHDIGHLLQEYDDKEVLEMGDFGKVDHEIIGAKFLEHLGFGEEICVPIANHVRSKKYLCFVDKNYLDLLSPASLQTLYYQGGPMDSESARTFENEQYFEESIALRRLDDQAKIEDFNIDTALLDDLFTRIENYPKSSIKQ